MVFNAFEVIFTSTVVGIGNDIVADVFVADVVVIAVNVVVVIGC